MNRLIERAIAELNELARAEDGHGRTRLLEVIARLDGAAATAVEDAEAERLLLQVATTA